jgi:hypothetical protein
MRVVRLIEGDAREVAPPTPPLAANPGPPAQRHDFQARIVGDYRPLRQPREIPGLGQGILLERVRQLELLLDVRQGNSHLLEIENGESNAPKELSQFSQLAAASCCDE